jgi:hypothetical protein
MVLVRNFCKDKDYFSVRAFFDVTIFILFVTRIKNASTDACKSHLKQKLDVHSHFFAEKFGSMKYYHYLCSRKITQPHIITSYWRDARVVEEARLESV